MQSDELVQRWAVRAGLLWRRRASQRLTRRPGRRRFAVGLGQAGAARLALARNAQTDAGSK
jgi:hypothetical protein